MHPTPHSPGALRRRLGASLAGCAVGLWLGGATLAEAQIRTVLVSPTPGNPVASGTTLRNALAAIPSASSADRWLVKIEPGIYDVGAIPLPMRPWVDVEGSGIASTVVRGSANGSGLNAGTIHGADSSELRFLTVEANHPSGAIAIYNPAASPRLYRLRIVAAGQLAWGVRSATAAPLIDECEISVTSTGGSGSQAYGLVWSAFSGLPSGRSRVLRSQISVVGGQNSYGVYMTEGQILAEVRDSRIDVLGGANTYGVYATGPSWSGAESLLLRDTIVYSAGSSATATGIRFESSVGIYLSVFGGWIWAGASPQTFGILQLGTSPAGVQGSSIVGLTQVAQSATSMIITSSELSGGPTTAGAWLGCVGVWDEVAVFYSGPGCPP
jgi:hypothetical protein